MRLPLGELKFNYNPLRSLELHVRHLNCNLVTDFLMVHFNADYDLTILKKSGKFWSTTEQVCYFQQDCVLKGLIRRFYIGGPRDRLQLGLEKWQGLGKPQKKKF